MSESTIDRLKHLASIAPNSLVNVYPGDFIEELDARLAQARQAALEEAAEEATRRIHKYDGPGDALRDMANWLIDQSIQKDNPELETCDCDRSVIHDCVCPQCRTRFLASQQPHATDAATAPRG